MNKLKRFIVICVLLVAFLAACNLIYATGHYTFSFARKLVALGINTVFSDTYDTATPAGTDDPSEADDRMREIKAAVQERLNVSMYFPLTGTQVSDTHAGEMRKIPFHESISDPTQVASHSDLYMQSDELRYQDDTNSAFNLTDAGKIAGANLKDDSVDADAIQLANDAYLTALDNAGTGTVNLFKATTSDGIQAGATLAMGSTKITGVADATASGDAIHLGQYAVEVAMTGGFSTLATTTADFTKLITFPNGLKLFVAYDKDPADFALDISGASFTAMYYADGMGYDSTSQDLARHLFVNALTTSTVTFGRNNSIAASSYEGIFAIVVGR